MSSSHLPLRQLLQGLLLRFIRYRDTEEQVTVLEEHAGVFPGVYGVCQRVRRYTHAYLTLSRKGMGPEGHLLVRAALEHAVTAQWVFFKKDGAARLQAKIAHDQLRLATMAGELDADDPLVLQLREAIPNGKRMPDWAHIRNALDDDTRFLSHSYQVLSQAVHVAHGVVRDVVDFEPDGGFSLRARPDDDLEHQVLYTTAASALLAWWVEATAYGD